MANMKKSRHLLVASGVAVLIVSSATGCTVGNVSRPATASPTASSTASPAPSSSSTSEAMSAVEPGQPHDAVDMDNWVASITASLGSEPTLSGVVAHLGPDSNSSLTTTDSRLDPGSYSYYFACRGDGNVTFTIENAGVEQVRLEGPCANQLLGGNFSTTELGADFALSSLDAPVDVVVRVTDRLSR